MTDAQASPGGPAGDAAARTLAPLTREAVGESLTRREMRWGRDDDGDIALAINSSVFFVLLLGPAEDVLHVRGTWHRSLPPQLAADAAQFCLEWNRDKVFPKLYTRIEDSGAVRLVGEVSTDLTAGAAPAQLDYLLQYGFSSSLQAFDEAGERFGEPADGSAR